MFFPATGRNKRNFHRIALVMSAAILLGCFLAASAISAPIPAASTEADGPVIVDQILFGNVVTLPPIKKLGGGTFRLSNSRGKKPVLFFFWNHASDYSVPHLKLLQKFAADPAIKNKVVILAVTRGATQAEREYVYYTARQHGITIPIAFDTRGIYANVLGIAHSPAYIALDRQGRIATLPCDDPSSPIRHLSFFQIVKSLIRNQTVSPDELIPFSENPRMKALAGTAMPSFTLKTITGEDYSFAPGDSGDKPLIVIFWHPYSESSLTELRGIATLLRVRGSEIPAKFIAISSLANQPQIDEARRFGKELGADIPMLIDPDSKFGKTAFKLTAIPAYIVVSPKGTIIDAEDQKRFDFRNRYDFLIRAALQK